MKSIVKSLNEALYNRNYQINEAESVLAEANGYFEEDEDYEGACDTVESAMDDFVEKLRPADYKKLGDPKQVARIFDEIAAFVRGVVDGMRDDNDFYTSDFDFSDPSGMMIEGVAMGLEDDDEFEGMSFEDIENMAENIMRAVPALFKKKMRRDWM